MIEVADHLGAVGEREAATDDGSLEHRVEQGGRHGGFGAGLRERELQAFGSHYERSRLSNLESRPSGRDRNRPPGDLDGESSVRRAENLRRQKLNELRQSGKG